MPLRTVMAPQLSQAGASDWKSANCSLRAVLGPASLGMMPARASSAALMSPSPLPLRVAVAVAVRMAVGVAVAWWLGAGGWGLGWRLASPLRLPASALGRFFREPAVLRLYGLVLTAEPLSF